MQNYFIPTATKNTHTCTLVEHFYSKQKLIFTEFKIIKISHFIAV